MFELFGKVCPRGPQSPPPKQKKKKTKKDCSKISVRFCRYAGYADVHVLQIRRFSLSRVPAFVPASASAAIADANCIGVRT